MFTGLIEKKGVVVANHRDQQSHRLVIATTYQPFANQQQGESIAVNGVCLTMLAGSPADELHFDLSPETLSRTTLANLSTGDAVNLERAMLASTRFGGHYVSGHVDAIAQVESIQQLDQFIQMDLAGFDEQAKLYLIPKGSITVEGVSLTLNRVANQRISLMLVPHTLAHTTLGSLKVGQQVNIEFDYLTRIVAHQLQVVGKLNGEVIKT